MINEITPQILIGEQCDASNEEALLGLGIDCILNVNDREYQNEKTCADRLFINYYFMPLPEENTKSMEDFKNAISKASVLLRKLTKTYNRILVHCYSSIDRAPLVVALYILVDKHIDLGEAYKIVKQGRKCIMEHYEWV